MSARLAMDFTPLAPARQANDLLVVRLRGSQAEMGAQHGRILMAAGGYEAAADFYPELPQRLLSDDSSTDIIQKAMNVVGKRLLDHGMQRMERNRPGPYLERTRAFMEATDYAPSLSRYLMIMDVFQNAVGLAGRLGLGPFSKRLAHRAPPACSTLMVWDDASADGTLRHARNFDLPGIGVWDMGPEVVMCDPDEGLRYGFVTTRGADTPGVTAFNEAGLTVTLHTRFHRDVRFDGAAVVDLGHDIARRAERVEDAIAIARERPICSTWGLAVSSSRDRRAVVLETTGKTVAVVEPGSNESFLMATNRYRHADTRRGEVSSSPAWAAHSDGREARMRQIVAAGRANGGLDTAGLGRLLGDHEDATDPGVERAGGSLLSQPITVKSVVVEHDHSQVTIGTGTVPTAWGPWQQVPFAWDGPVGQVRDAFSARGTETTDCPYELQNGSRFRDGAAGRGYEHFVEANRVHMETHDGTLTLRELERAITADPSEPTYRFLAGAILMRRGLWYPALSHFEAGLAHENAPFRRGQLLLWGARTADAVGQHDRGEAMRRELLTLQSEHLQEHHAQARKELRHGYSKRRLRNVRMSMELVDIL